MAQPVSASNLVLGVGCASRALCATLVGRVAGWLRSRCVRLDRRLASQQQRSHQVVEQGRDRQAASEVSGVEGGWPSVGSVLDDGVHNVPYPFQQEGSQGTQLRDLGNFQHLLSVDLYTSPGC